MSTELHDALAQAADAGRARFDSRDAAEVISPATRRVSRHRTAVRVGSGLASVVAIAGVLWAVDGIGTNTDVDPALPSGVTNGIFDAESLLASATARTRTETDAGTFADTPGLRCEIPIENPHVEKPDYPSIVGVDCTAVWLDGSVKLEAGEATITPDAGARTITYDWRLVNTGDAPVKIDAAGIVPVLIAQADGDVAGPIISTAKLSVADSWSTETQKVSVVVSDEDIRVLKPGDAVSGTTVWDTQLGDADAVQRVLDGESTPSFEFRVRVAPHGEASTTEVFLDIADGELGGNQSSTTSAWDVEDLAAIAQPRAADEQRPDATAGMICYHEQPDHDPRITDLTTTDGVALNRTVFEDCDPVWFVDGPMTTARDFVADASVAADGSVTLGTAIRNAGYRSLVIDDESVFAWVESAAAPELPHMWNQAGVARSIWDENGKVFANLDSRATPKVIGTEEFLDISITETGQTEDLVGVLNSGERYSVTYWARVHEDAPDGSATYLIELGTPDEH